MFVSYLFGDEIMMNSIFLWQEIWKSIGMAFMNWFAPLMVLGTTVLTLVVHWKGVYWYTKSRSTHVALHTIVLSIEGVLLRPLFGKASCRGDLYSGERPTTRFNRNPYSSSLIVKHVQTGDCESSGKWDIGVGLEAHPKRHASGRGQASFAFCIRGIYV